MKDSFRYIGFILLTFALFVVGYMVCYCGWMNAHPVYQSDEWKSLFYQRLTLFVPICLAWLWSVKTLFFSKKTEAP